MVAILGLQKDQIFEAVRRMYVQIADIVVSKPIGEKSRNNPARWAECVAGAVIEETCLNLLGAHAVELSMGRAAAPAR